MQWNRSTVFLHQDIIAIDSLSDSLTYTATPSAILEFCALEIVLFTYTHQTDGSTWITKVIDKDMWGLTLLNALYIQYMYLC